MCQGKCVSRCVYVCVSQVIGFVSHCNLSSFVAVFVSTLSFRWFREWLFRTLMSVVVCIALDTHDCVGCDTHECVLCIQKMEEGKQREYLAMIGAHDPYGRWV